MLLTIDVGNSNIKLGVYDGAELKLISRTATDLTKIEDQYAIEIKSILELYNLKFSQINRVVIGSVVPSVTAYLRKAIKKLFHVEAVIVKYDTDPTLEIAIKEPRETGADLVLACISAKENHRCPCIIIDMGTATKLIVLDKDGRMLGGSIIPGLGVSLNALFKNAALLTAVNLETPEKVIGDTTDTCIQSGAVFGSAAMLDSLCSRIEEELGYSCMTVATGGLAEMVVKNCKRDIVYDETLLLDGLRIVSDRIEQA